MSKATTEAAAEVITGVAILGVLGTIAYFVVSEGSRVVFPPRNLIPVI